jgi:hypothetical protein
LGAHSGAAGGNHEIQARFISELSQLLFDDFLVVWQHFGVNDGKSGVVQHLLNHRTTPVLPFTPGSPIAYGQDCCSSHTRRSNLGEKFGIMECWNNGFN